ncbi:MAG: hypothetical protein KGO53_05610 [Alphaproteobacteria bacterium]|nr:hypothetical protein [Alphaproteobacteria bacterium]
MAACFMAAGASGATLDAGQTEVTDQGDTLQCWAVAIASRLDLLASRAAGVPLKISARYLFYAKTRAEVIIRLHAGKFEKHEEILCELCKPEAIYYEQGGVLADAVEAVTLEGAIPEAAYPGFPKEDEELFRDINRLFAEYDANPNLPRDEASTRPRIEAILDRHLGRPPAEFKVQGATYDARSFAAKYLANLHEANATELNYWPGTKNEKTVEEAFDGHAFVNYWTGNQQDIFKALEISLQNHEPTLISYWYIGEAHQRDRIGFRVNGLKPPRRLNWDAADLLGHYVLALRLKKGANGNIKAIYVKNTFGLTRKEGYGFHWLERDYFPLISGVEISSHVQDILLAKGILKQSQ